MFGGPGGDSVVTDYSEAYSLDFTERGPFMYPERRETLADIVERLRAKIPNGRLLDVGCGDGQFLSLCRPYYECSGVEPSETLSRHAGQLVRVPVTRAEYSADLFPRASFDVVTLVQVLEHLTNPRDILAACHSHLRPGGVVVIEVPSIRAPHFLLYRATRLKWFVDNSKGVINSHFGYYGPRSLDRLVNSCGFQTSEIVTGRWAVKYRGIKQTVGRVADPLLDRLRIGGLLMFAEK